MHYAALYGGGLFFNSMKNLLGGGGGEGEGGGGGGWGGRDGEGRNVAHYACASGDVLLLDLIKSEKKELFFESDNKGMRYIFTYGRVVVFICRNICCYLPFFFFFDIIMIIRPGMYVCLVSHYGKKNIKKSKNGVLEVYNKIIEIDPEILTFQDAQGNK